MNRHKESLATIVHYIRGLLHISVASKKQSLIQETAASFTTTYAITCATETLAFRKMTPLMMKPQEANETVMGDVHTQTT